MDIRLIYENEVQMAVYTAHEIFEMCVRPYTQSGKEAEQFYGYVRAENLWQEMHEGRLMIWGAFDGGRMCAVAAMQSVGHITMLYVRPQYTRRKIGTRMLNYMCEYAHGILHKERVTVNVMPIVAASYFYRNGFVLMQNVPWSDTYVSLERRTAGILPKKPEVTYKPRHVSAKCIVALTAGVLIFSFTVMASVTIHHMATDGLLTEAEYELQNDDAVQIIEDLPVDMGEPQEI